MDMVMAFHPPPFCMEIFSYTRRPLWLIVIDGTILYKIKNAHPYRMRNKAKVKNPSQKADAGNQHNIRYAFIQNRRIHREMHFRHIDHLSFIVFVIGLWC